MKLELTRAEVILIYTLCEMWGDTLPLPEEQELGRELAAKMYKEWHNDLSGQ